MPPTRAGFSRDSEGGVANVLRLRARRAIPARFRGVALPALYCGVTNSGRV